MHWSEYGATIANVKRLAKCVVGSCSTAIRAIATSAIAVSTVSGRPGPLVHVLLAEMSCSATVEKIPYSVPVAPFGSSFFGVSSTGPFFVEGLARKLYQPSTHFVENPIKDSLHL